MYNKTFNNESMAVNAYNYIYLSSICMCDIIHVKLCSFADWSQDRDKNHKCLENKSNHKRPCQQTPSTCLYPPDAVFCLVSVQTTFSQTTEYAICTNASIYNIAAYIYATYPKKLTIIPLFTLLRYFPKLVKHFVMNNFNIYVNISNLRGHICNVGTARNQLSIPCVLHSLW